MAALNTLRPHLASPKRTWTSYCASASPAVRTWHVHQVSVLPGARLRDEDELWAFGTEERTDVTDGTRSYASVAVRIEGFYPTAMLDITAVKDAPTQMAIQQTMSQWCRDTQVVHRRRAIGFDYARLDHNLTRPYLRLFLKNTNQLFRLHEHAAGGVSLNHHGQPVPTPLLMHEWIQPPRKPGDKMRFGKEHWAQQFLTVNDVLPQQWLNFPVVQLHVRPPNQRSTTAECEYVFAYDHAQRVARPEQVTVDRSREDHPLLCAALRMSADERALSLVCSWAHVRDAPPVAMQWRIQPTPAPVVRRNEPHAWEVDVPSKLVLAEQVLAVVNRLDVDVFWVCHDRFADMGELAKWLPEGRTWGKNLRAEFRPYWKRLIGRELVDMREYMHRNQTTFHPPLDAFSLEVALHHHTMCGDAVRSTWAADCAGADASVACAAQAHVMVAVFRHLLIMNDACSRSIVSCGQLGEVFGGPVRLGVLKTQRMQYRQDMVENLDQSRQFCTPAVIRFDDPRIQLSTLPLTPWDTYPNVCVNRRTADFTLLWLHAFMADSHTHPIAVFMRRHPHYGPQLRRLETLAREQLQQQQQQQREQQQQQQPDSNKRSSSCSGSGDDVASALVTSSKRVRRSPFPPAAVAAMARLHKVTGKPKPGRKKDDERYKGGITHEPQVGLHLEFQRNTLGQHASPIATLDFKSLYPSIMQACNVCFSAILLQGDEKAFDDRRLTICYVPINETECVAVVQCVDGKPVEGFLPATERELMAKRAEYKALLKQAKKEGNKAAAEIYDMLQAACKILANSFYGFLNAKHPRAFPELMAVVTSLGRNFNIYMSYASLLMQSAVMMGDTDSIMPQKVAPPEVCALPDRTARLRYWFDHFQAEAHAFSDMYMLFQPPFLGVPYNVRQRRLEVFMFLRDRCLAHKLPLVQLVCEYAHLPGCYGQNLIELELDGINVVMNLPPIRKNYITVLLDEPRDVLPDPKSKGLGFTKRSAAPWVRKMGKVIATMICDPARHEEILPFTQACLDNLLQGHVTYDDLRVTVALKKPHEYKNADASLIQRKVAVKIEARTGHDPSGQRISYVVVRGEGKKNERGEEAEYAKAHQLPLDLDHYIQQVDSCIGPAILDPGMRNEWNQCIQQARNDAHASQFQTAVAALPQSRSFASLHRKRAVHTFHQLAQDVMNVLDDDEDGDSDDDPFMDELDE